MNYGNQHKHGGQSWTKDSHLTFVQFIIFIDKDDIGKLGPRLDRRVGHMVPLQTAGIVRLAVGAQEFSEILVRRPRLVRDTVIIRGIAVSAQIAVGKWTECKGS